MEKFILRVTTVSNLFIGGNPTLFEIGGIDQQTITDSDQLPIIPASTIKGVFRAYLHEIANDEIPAIKAIVSQYGEVMEAINKNNNKILAAKDGKVSLKIEKERIDKLQKSMLSSLCQDITWLFGIQGYNRTPKLIFNDLLCLEKEAQHCFSVDTKNAILQEGTEIYANPRTYKTVRPKITFEGEILCYRLIENGFKVEDIEACLQLVVDACNEGLCRIGESGSRGYGRVLMELKRG